MTTANIPRLPKLLGVAGLIPFTAFAAALWLFPDNYLGQLDQALRGYGAVILAFMGAVHWGLGMHSKLGTNSYQLGLSVIPPLIGWLALLLPASWSYAVLLAGFSLLCIADTCPKRITHGRVWLGLFDFRW